MSKDKIQLLSPLFLKYQADYEKNPRSRVFAPLAETYRKLGMTDKAMEILSQGIRFHPGYVMGYLGLAFCYFDVKQFTLAYNTLRPLVDTSRDNIRLQKLFADVCLELNYKQEALDTYKYLLFINPRDRDVAIQVATLESLIEEQYKPIHQPIYIPESDLKTESKKSYNSDQLFDIDKLDNKPNSSKADFDDWMALDLSREQKTTKAEDPYEFWNLKKGETNLDSPQETPVEKVEEKPKASTLVELARAIKQEPVEPVAPKIHVELDLDDDDSDDELTENASVSQKIPMVTHTLVDLYCGQGHMEKALEVLEKILILNPHDEKTIKKISEIKSLMGHYEEEMPEERVVEEINVSEVKAEAKNFPKPYLEALKETSEEDGRKTLMSLIDQQVGPELSEAQPLKKQPVAAPVKEAKTSKKTSVATLEMQKKQLLEEKLNKFLKKIQKRALDYQARL